MHRFYRLLRPGVTIVATCVIVPVVGEFFIELAKDYHLYEMPAKLPGTAAGWVQGILKSPWSWGSGLLLAGLTIGLWLDTFVKRAARVTPIPRASKWLDASDAIEAFADPNLKSELKHLQEKVPQLKSSIDSLQTLIAEKKATDYPGTPALDTLAASASMGSLMAQHRKAIDDLNALAEPAWQKENEILNNVISQLKQGQLVGKGFRHHLNRVADAASLIPLDQWQLLTFDTYDQKRQTVSGGGKKYVGLQIGRNENPPR
jgi:hypothetical protein